jgi:hypothetical protein
VALVEGRAVHDDVRGQARQGVQKIGERRFDELEHPEAEEEGRVGRIAEVGREREVRGAARLSDPSPLGDDRADVAGDPSFVGIERKIAFEGNALRPCMAAEVEDGQLAGPEAVEPEEDRIVARVHARGEGIEEGRGSRIVPSDIPSGRDRAPRFGKGFEQAEVAYVSGAPERPGVTCTPEPADGMQLLDPIEKGGAAQAGLPGVVLSGARSASPADPRSTG